MLALTRPTTAIIRARDVPRSCTCRWTVRWHRRYWKTTAGRWVPLYEPWAAFRVRPDPMCHWHAPRPAEEL